MKSNFIARNITTIAIVATALVMSGCASQSAVESKSDSAPNITRVGESAPNDSENKEPVQVLSKSDVDIWIRQVWSVESFSLVRKSRLPIGVPRSVFVDFALQGALAKKPCQSMTLVDVRSKGDQENGDITSKNNSFEPEIWNILYCSENIAIEVTVDENELVINGKKAGPVAQIPL